MITICRLDRELYLAVCPDIITDEVVLTDERAEHIRQRHPGDFERYFVYMAQIITQPDYIIGSDRPCTAIILKQIEDEDGGRFKLVIKLQTGRGNPEYKNSVITFWRIHDKEWERLLRNKLLLYKR